MPLDIHFEVWKDPFAVFMKAGADLIVTAADFDEAFRQLPELLVSSSAAHKRYRTGIWEKFRERGDVSFKFLTTRHIRPSHRHLCLPRKGLHESLSFWMG
ncbi:hypothetical protein M413DRAFT_326337 [Hebeloma cylindrosporum]|uniref:Uncharacterized protein n=1 Tax=Hebeloma cylindrosporum TaxID=76867 RepID=A0A0C2Y3Z0_HEBCY|nr:hypothetical protein M413DRAFT_326337 [Hebeloma cylindrosporum h7]